MTNVMEVFNHFLIRTEVYYIRRSLYLALLKLPMSTQVMGLRRELNVLLLLNGQNIKMTSNDLLLYIQGHLSICSEKLLLVVNSN